MTETTAPAHGTSEAAERCYDCGVALNQREIDAINRCAKDDAEYGPMDHHRADCGFRPENT